MCWRFETAAAAATQFSETLRVGGGRNGYRNAARIGADAVRCGQYAHVHAAADDERTRCPVRIGLAMRGAHGSPRGSVFVVPGLWSERFGDGAAYAGANGAVAGAEGSLGVDQWRKGCRVNSEDVCVCCVFKILIYFQHMIRHSLV